MGVTRYLAIDKTIIKEGMEFGFNIFIPSDENKKMRPFKERGSPLTSDEKNVIDTTNLLYVLESEHERYEAFRKTISDTSVKVKNVSFADQVSAIYKNAAKVLETLFSEPEKLANYQKSKQVVNDLVETILDDSITIKSLMSIATHDYYTHTHSINVSIYALSLGEYLKLNQESLSELGEAALLHDLGKSKISSSIINKKGTLTDIEFKEIQRHPSLGYSIGKRIGIHNERVLKAIRHHHEKMDGTGYPLGLKGKEIPLFARMIGLCDVFDALTSRRSYKEPLSTFEALKLMKTEMKNHIDINLLNKMIEMFK